MIKITFSIIIATHNRPDALDQTLKHLENQETDLGFEVILINDGPAEAIPGLNFGQGKRAEWKFIQNPKNLGRAPSRNKGINEARGEYILFTDDDIWTVPGFLDAHYEKQREIGGGVVVGAVPPADEIANTPWHSYIRQRFDRIHKRLNSDSLDYGLFLTGNVSVPTKAIRNLDGFNENLKYYSFQDTELGLRLYNEGLKFAHAPKAIGYHFFEENLNKLCNKAYNTGKSSFIFVKLHPEEASSIQFHSIELAPWKGSNIFKNTIKILLFNNLSICLLKKIIQGFGFLNCNKVVCLLLPYLELSYRAKGLKEIKSENRN